MAQLPAGYITAEDADAYLGTREPWFSAVIEDKNNALSQGRIYIDSTYECISYYTSNENGEASDKVQIANAELGNSYLLDPNSLFSSDAKANSNLTKNRVVAGDVESEKQYNSAGIGYIDPFPYITSLLNGECSFMASSVQRNIVRS